MSFFARGLFVLLTTPAFAKELATMFRTCFLDQFFFFFFIYAYLVNLATLERVIGHQVVCLGHLGGFVAF